MEFDSSETRQVEGTRERAAAATQRAIVEAAGRLFARDGYTGTAVADIAAEAGVAVQTIYNAIGGKSAVLARVLDFAAAGEEAPVPVPVFMEERARAASDARAVIAQLVSFWRGAMRRTAALNRVVREAAALDPAIARLERDRSSRRLANYAIAARMLRERDALRAGLTDDEAAARIFALGHPEAYRQLVTVGGWSVDRWAAWTQRALEDALLEPGTGT